MTDDRPVKLADYEHILQQIIPGAELRDTGRSVGVMWTLRQELPYVLVANDRRAEEMLRVFGEQVRARVIRDMGVQPIIDGYRAEADRHAEMSRSLQWRLDAALSRIDDLEARLEATDD